MPRTIFRVFFSSTFGDFQAEREKLRAEVWPRLEALCASYGASFHVVDLRWGISPSVATTHDTIQICLDEVKRCQELSPVPKPNFLMLIGDRYGWRPPAVEIPDADFRKIQKAASKDDAAFLASWYRRDDNSVPPVWCLLPREGEYASYDAWGPVENRLVAIQHKVAEKLALAPEKYLYSATHMEIVDGLLKLDGLQDHLFSFNRTLNGLPDPAPKGIARRFADYLPDGSRDPEAVTLLEKLKQQIAETLPDTQIHLFQADWLGVANSPISTAHLEKLCSDVETALLDVIKPELEQIAATSPLEEELQGQKQFLQETGSLLIGRDKELKRIKAYLDRKKTPYPLIIQATGGCGKSALMARAILSCETEVSGTLIYRFIGAAPRSWQPQTFLEDLIIQTAEAYGQQPPELPEDRKLKDLSELFQQQMGLASEEQPLTIFIDAIDQFSSTAPVQYRDLFPEELPTNVKMVVSVLDGKDADQLNALYPKSPKIQLEPLSPNACGKILDALLQGRKLTKEQRSAILDKAQESGLPLWLTLAAPIARKLSSWDTAPDLPADIKELARYVVKRIADKHGHAITIASLRYIKLARFGLSETELQEILWRDPEVKAEFDQNKNPDQPPVTDLPPIFWSRLYAEFDPYVNEYWMDGQLLHRYFHRVFGEVADEMDGETRKTLHSRLADYFAQQPLYLPLPLQGLQGEGRGGDGAELQPNGRKLMELPWHLSLSGRIEEARATITDFDFAMAKCRLNRSDDWVNDFRLASHGEKTLDYRIWESFAKSNAHILRRGSADWPTHKILLQLAIEHADDSPATIGAEKFLDEGKCDWSWLRRELRVKHAGIDPCEAVFEGHGIGVMGMLELSNSDIVSWGQDDDIRVWDRETGLCKRIMNRHTKRINAVQLLPGNKLLSTSEDASFVIWNYLDGTANKIEGHSSCPHVTLLSDGLFATSASTDNEIVLWNFDDEVAVLEGHTEPITQTISLRNGRLISASEDKTLRLWDLHNHSCLAVMEGHSEAVTNILLITDNRVLSWSEDKTIRVWDLDNYCCLAVMEGNQEFIKGVRLLPDNRVLSWSQKMSESDSEVCTGLFVNEDRTIDSPLVVWSLDSGRCLAVMEGHSKAIRGVRLLPDNKVLSVSEDETMRLWDLNNYSCLSVLEGHVGNIVGVQSLPENRVLSWSGDNTLRLWELESGHCLVVMEGHTDGINGVHIISENRALSWSNDKTLRLWDISNFCCLMTMTGHADAVSGCIMLNDGKALSRSQDRTLRIWHLEIDRCVTLPNSHVTLSKSWMKVRFNNSIALTWCQRSPDYRMLLWNIADGRCLATMEGHTDNMNGVHLLHVNKALSWSKDNTLRLWNLENGHCLSVMDRHRDSISGVHLLSENRALSWSKDKTLRLWELESGKCLVVMDGHTDSINGVHLLTDNRALSWSRDKMMIWELESGECLAVMQGHTSKIIDVHLISDNRALSWSRDKMVVWEMECGKCLVTMEEHTGKINDVYLISDNRVLSCSVDNTLRLWELENGKCLAVMVGHTDIIKGAHMLPENRALSWSDDDTLRQWDLENGQCLAVIEGHTGYNDVHLLSESKVLVSSDCELSLYNIEGGQCLSTYVRSAYLNSDIFSAPKEIWQAFLGANNITESAGIDAMGNYVVLAFEEKDKLQKLKWYATSKCESHRLFEDGRAIITQANGQVCFLQTYSGNHQISNNKIEA